MMLDFWIIVSILIASGLFALGMYFLFIYFFPLTGCCDEIVKLQNDVYMKNLKARPLPKITLDNSAKFLPAWYIEKMHYPSETQQLQVLREATVDKIDKQIIDKLTSVAEVMSHFYSRYGTQEAVAKRVLDDLELLPSPSDACLKEALSISHENRSRNLWTLDRVG